MSTKVAITKSKSLASEMVLLAIMRSGMPLVNARRTVTFATF